jgi:hypothetical protein
MTMATNNPLSLALTLAESSLILEALIERPFKLVFELIGRLNQQAQQFYQPGIQPEVAQIFYLSQKDISLCVKSLGDLPFNRVQPLLANIHLQLQSQNILPQEANDDDL